MSLITVGPTKPASAPAIVSSATESTRVAPPRSVRVLTIVAPEPLPLEPATAIRWTWAASSAASIRIVPLWTAENGPTRSVNSPW